MKKNIFILPLLAISVLLGCTPPSSEKETSSPKEGPKDERIAANGINDSYYKF